MTPIFHSTTTLRVERQDNQIRAETTLLSSLQEAVGWLWADLFTLEITSAGWALYRSPLADSGYYPLPELHGLEAFLQSGPAIKEALQNHDPLAYRLLAESIRGVVQAETFFYQERGYISAAAYDQMWDSMYANACRYYSHLDQVEKPWMEYAGTEMRTHHLFHRSQSVTITRDEKRTHILAVFMDSFHELQVQISVDARGRIQQVGGDFLRAPDSICSGNRSHLEKLLGTRPDTLTKKDLAMLAGGAEGCHHLVDLLHYVVDCWQQVSENQLG